MSETTFDRLNKETAKIEWGALERFFAQGRLLVVAPGLDLVRVAAAIADDDKDYIEPLINAEKIVFASADWVKNEVSQDTLLWTVVVAPYVIVQLA